MKTPNNPFLVRGYHSARYFCNRNEETLQLKETLTNNNNITIFSPRRLGKTGLIFHLFHTLKKKEYNTIYLDIYSTENLNQFIHELANAVIKSIVSRKEQFLEKALTIFKNLRPQVSINELSGMPEVSLLLQDEKEKKTTLHEIFQLLETHKIPNIIAIDEFQQINKYPEKNTERILRSHIQHLKNSQFIFSGSQRHLLLPMFTDAKRAFYQSTAFLSLDKLKEETYAAFIMQHFKENNQLLSDEALQYILDWTKTYTFYTQYLCNKIFQKRYKEIKLPEVKTAIQDIYAERETIYYNYRQLLPYQQFKLLKAMALENIVQEPTGNTFIKKYNLGNPSTVRKSLLALTDKELVYDHPQEGKITYEVYDVFLSRWLQMIGKD